MGMAHEIVDWVHDNRDAFSGIDRITYDWREVGESIGLLGGLSERSIDFIGAWPAEMRDVLISLLAAHGRGDATVRLSWAPAYDFTMTISKANFGEGAEYSVHLGSKYPPEL